MGAIVSRPYLTAGRLADLERTLAPRERAIIETLDRLRVATTDHLKRLHFADLTPHSASREAPRLLARLAERRIVLKLERQLGGIRAGSRAAVWSLDLAGQRLASVCGPAGGRRVRRPWTPSLAFLAHRLAVSACCVSLTERCRSGAGDLLAFDAEPLSWRRYASPYGGTAILKPDAFVRLAAGDFERGAFVEIDRATEARATIAGKLRTYRQYWETGREQQRRGYFPRVVFAVPDEGRKAVLVDLCAAQPEETWPLWQVVLSDDLTDALIGAGS
ncbi:MAG: replication-relaxation family protein [Solirubrobacterales bacterium]